MRVGQGIGKQTQNRPYTHIKSEVVEIPEVVKIFLFLKKRSFVSLVNLPTLSRFIVSVK